MAIKRTAEDRRFSKLVRERDNYTCRRCGHGHLPNSQGLACAHIFTRGIKRTRHDPENAIALCTSCHFRLDSRPEEKEALARQILGDDRYDALRLRAHTPLKRVAR